MFLGTSIALGSMAATSRGAAAALFNEATVLNDLSATSTPATNSIDPYTGLSSSGVRRRRPLLVAGRTVQADLVEGSRTNLCVRSQEFDDASWLKVNTTVTANATTAPDGTATAEKLAATAVNNVHYIGQSQAKAASSLPYVFTVYLKQAEYRYGGVQITDGANGAQMRMDLQTGTVTNSGTFGSGFAVVSASAVSVGNGWYRCVLSITSSAAATIDPRTRVLLNDDNNSYTGDGTSGIFAWGAQLEQAAFPSTYIPTAGSTVTRGADSLSVSLASLPGGGLSTTAGTILALAVPEGWTGDQDGATAWRIAQSLSPGVGNFTLYRTSAIGTTIIRVDGGGNQTTGFTHGLTDRTIRRIGAVWDAVSVRGFLEGVAVGVPDTTLTAPYTAATDMFVGRNSAVAADYFHGWVALLYWPRALTAAEINTISQESGLAGAALL